MLIISPDPFLAREVEKAVDNIRGAQHDDGYINTYYTVSVSGETMRNVFRLTPSPRSWNQANVGLTYRKRPPVATIIRHVYLIHELDGLTSYTTLVICWKQRLHTTSTVRLSWIAKESSLTGFPPQVTQTDYLNLCSNI